MRPLWMSWVCNLRSWFIQEYDWRIADQFECNRQTFFLTARQRSCIGVDTFLQTEHCQRTFNLRKWDQYKYDSRRKAQIAGAASKTHHFLFICFGNVKSQFQMCGNCHHFSHRQIRSQRIVLVNVDRHVSETFRIA